MDENEDEELYASLSCCGWLIVEITERMIEEDFTNEEICKALSFPTESHMYYILARANAERQAILGELS